jgi:aspartate carbamoyltransferase catalytic subunit
MVQFRNPVFSFVAPQELSMPNEYKLFLASKDIKYFEYPDFPHSINDADIIYMTRVQKERFGDPVEYEKVKNVYILRNHMLERTKPNMRILHPLPRINEIHTDVDSNPKAYYFEQARNGVFTRMAIIAHLLNLR